MTELPEGFRARLAREAGRFRRGAVTRVHAAAGLRRRKSAEQSHCGDRDATRGQDHVLNFEDEQLARLWLSS